MLVTLPTLSPLNCTTLPGVKPSTEPRTMSSYV